jgi:3-hydroxyisobutyrate dehydrogenase
MARIAFLGLGVMGFPMAGHLKVKGSHDVTVCNRARAKSEAWVARYGGMLKATPREASEGQDVIVTCVSDDDALRAVLLGDDGAFAGARRGTIIIDHTTASAQVARELHAAAQQKGLDFLDAPVSGGEPGARDGTLTVMCGGDAAAAARVAPVVTPYSRAFSFMGGPGCGQLAKMANQICIAGILQSLAEGIHFAQRAGLDVDTLMAAISKGAAQSWQMDNRCRPDGNNGVIFSFASDWLMHKDLGICLDEARRLGATLPIANAVRTFCSIFRERGSSASLLTRLEGAQ